MPGVGAQVGRRSNFNVPSLRMPIDNCAETRLSHPKGLKPIFFAALNGNHLTFSPNVQRMGRLSERLYVSGALLLEIVLRPHFQHIWPAWTGVLEDK